VRRHLRTIAINEAAHDYIKRMEVYYSHNAGGIEAGVQALVNECNLEEQEARRLAELFEKNSK
jgi:hypothetical protein